jgi:CubicO group peptidase (beta-lactamase class C family)
MEFGCRRLAIMFCRPSRLALLFSLVQILAAVDRFEPIRTLIRARLVETGVASIAVAVAKDGEIVWEQGFGWADHEKRLAATQHTSYSLASISKPITAPALITLVEAGKIDLDHPINDYVGDAKLRGSAGDAKDDKHPYGAPEKRGRSFEALVATVDSLV